MSERLDSLAYKAEDFETELPAQDYFERFCDAERFIKYCKECGNYGKVWACPPFPHDLGAELGQYAKVKLMATKIVPDETAIPLTGIAQFLRPERLRVEKKLREMEKSIGGRAFAFAGSCLYCPEGRCTRPEGRPCQHPDLVRPSLEAYGFDLGKTAEELFGMPLLWSHDGNIPRYIVLISGLFY